MADKKTIKTPFGELPVENRTITMSNSQLYAEYEKRGLPNAKETIETYNKVRADMQHEASVFLKKQILKDEDPEQEWKLRAGMKESRFDVTVKPEVTVTIPGRAGEPTQSVTRPGATQVKNYSKVPDAIANDAEEKKLSDQIGELLAARKAGKGVKIKISA